MSHLELKVNNRPLVLDDNFQLAIEDANPLFNDHTMYSYPVTIPLDGNRHYVRNIEDPASDIRPVDLEHAAMQINVEGIPFRSGTAIISEDEHLTNRLSLNIDANEVSFSDLIADLNCRDVKVKDDIVIGHKLSRVRITADTRVTAIVNFQFPGTPSLWTSHFRAIFDEHIDNVIEPQALGFSVPDVVGIGEATYVDRVYSYGKESTTIKVPTRQRAYINTSRPYGETDERTGQPVTYCNARVCYKHYAADLDGKTADFNVPRAQSANAYEDIYPYWVLDADRPQSGICFYVLYFLDCLFHQIGYTFDNSELLDVEDLKRLCFYTTRCRYDLHDEDERKPYTQHYSGDVSVINDWLNAHGCGGTLAYEAGDEAKSLNSITTAGFTYTVGGVSPHPFSGLPILVRSIEATTTIDTDNYKVSGRIMPMYANSDNFPDMSVTSLLQSLENQFGIRFLVDEDKHHVRATFFRNVFRDTRPPVNFPMQIDSISPISEKITGVKVGYTAESDDKEQRANLRNSVRDYNTDYDYIDYNKERLVTGLDLYKQIFRSPGNNDMHLYVDLSTGNRYRIKVDSEAKTASALHPVIYQVGQHHHVEFGDCREINSDYIHELRSELIPVPLNDVNYYNEAATKGGGVHSVDITIEADGETRTHYGDLIADAVKYQPILVPYCDEDMEHEFVEQRINNVISEGLADAYLTTVLRLQESYDPTKTDDGNSPLQSYDWGNAIAIMRGGGDPEKDGVMYYDNNYDGFQNSKWRVSAQDYQISTDNIDQFCGGYEYKGEQFSLKPRAYVTVPWQPQGVTASAPEADGYDLVVDDPAIKDRGYADHFLREYIHFLLHRKPYVIEGKAEAALLATIPEYWTRRFRIGTMIGYINRVTYNIDVKTGIRKCQIYFYA